MITEVKIESVFALNLPIIDVRSPGEFDKGHIPGAVNIPLFTNDERAHVGTVYKQVSKEKAIEVGYEYVIPKLKSFVTESLAVAPKAEVIVHCWRGGMRSRSFAQHLSENGFSEVKVIVGGYKAFRNHVLNEFKKPVQLKVLGGYTGSGKTYLLKAIKKLGHQVIDLEGVAHHKGSAFGAIGEKSQPTSEQFENNLFTEWQTLDLNQPVWIEDESLSIGRVNLPYQLYVNMRAAELIFIDIPKAERSIHLVSEYTNIDDEQLADSLTRITKRLGGKNVQDAIAYLKDKNYFEVAMIALFYYDKAYLRGMNSRDAKKVIRIPLGQVNHAKNAIEILNATL